MSGQIAVNNMYISYFGKTVVENLSFTFKTGNLIGIIGPNGAGKSTLIKGMLSHIPRDGGTIQINNQPIHHFRKKIAYVPQRNIIDWDFPILVKDTVLLGTYPQLGLFKRPKKAEKEWANHCLEKVGMLDYQKKQIAELSGGQQQRVFLARALAQKADFFFLDEPFVGIDVASETMMINILKQLRNEGKTIFIVHHDLTKVEEYFDELILINKQLIEAGPVEQVVQPDLMREAYDVDPELLSRIGVGG